MKALRFLAVDAVERADVGDPGTAMALAPFAHAIGHASMLLFGALHLSGYDLSLDDLRQYPTGSWGPGDAAAIARVAGGWHAPELTVQVNR